MTQVPDACTLPVAEQPARVAELDALLSRARLVGRPAPTAAVLEISGEEGAVRDLLDRETSCCSFFTFRLTRAASGALTLGVEVPEAQVGVLDALVDRAAR